ncbi:AraC family transcriptional regulator [Methylobacterium sp. BTF04]|uniref:helix-turn-helix domain-containing protein n=1 Tax=Methylobacterium sp. BTF04 TaxID=2708300 RepID=UPI0032B2F1FE
MIHTELQSTQGVADRQAFDYWRSTALARVDASLPDPTLTFRAERSLSVTRHATVIHTRSDPVGIERRAHHIRGDGVDDVSISLLIGGRGYHEQGSHGARVEAGDISFGALNSPFASGASERYEEVRLFVPRATFLAQVGQVEPLAGRVLQGGSVPSTLFSSYVHGFARAVPYMSEADVAIALEGTLHLLRGLVDAQDQKSAMPASEATLRSLAVSHIERRMHDPALGPAEICKTLGISRSRLYAAFRNEAGVAAAIRNARLERAHRRLSSSGSATDTVATIMFACGLTDAPSFSRSFRRRFGMTPRDVRATHRR